MKLRIVAITEKIQEYIRAFGADGRADAALAEVDIEAREDFDTLLKPHRAPLVWAKTLQVIIKDLSYKAAKRVTQLAEEIAVHVVPTVDLDGVRNNIELVGDIPEVAALLQLHNHRDLEGEFGDGGHPEAEALRDWLA